jgi:sodium transport system permease protein
MNLEPRTVATLLGNELRLLLRSPRTLFMSIVLPLLFWPVMMWLTNLATERQEAREEATVFRYVLSGDESAAAGKWIARAVELDAEGEEPSFEQVPAAELVDEQGIALGHDLEAALDRELIHFYIDAESGTPTPTLRIYLRADREIADSGVDRLRDGLRSVRSELRIERLAARDVAVDPDTLLAIDRLDVATAAHASGTQLGRFLTLMMIVLLLSGGSIVAMDSLAGEKERGTLETLLTTAATRDEIVAAKSLAIFVTALVITVVMVGNGLVWVSLDLIALPETFTVPMTPPVALLLLLLFLPLAALVTSSLLLVSAWAKSYKEAQLYFFPLFLITAVPAVAAMLPGATLRSALVAVPISNLSIAVREVLSGTFDWPLLLVTFTINTAVAVAIARVSARALRSERLITASEWDAADLYGGPALFSRHVLRWFAVLWAVFLVWQLNVAPGTDVRLILVINMSLFVGGSLWMMRRYRLPARETLALRPVKPVIWLAVGIGAPAGLVVSSLVAIAGNFIFDIPDELLERFSQQLLPDSFSLAEALFFVAVLPAICEEIAFRGVLLQGLYRKLSPAMTLLVVGAVFGIFHVALFRILPTAFLGVLLGGLVLLTGSLLPAILWHFIHNALGVLIDHYGWAEDASPMPMYAGAVALLMLSAGMVWIGRTPYPRPAPQRPSASSPPEADR